MGDGSFTTNPRVELVLLNLSDLSVGNIPAITPAMGAALAEAGAVCLESQGHTTGVRLAVRGYRDGGYTLGWPAVTAQAQSAWNDPRNATEMGAAGISVLVADAAIEYTVIEASRQGTGFDYWLGDEMDTTFQRKAGLEVSGIRQGTDAVIRRRVSEKLRQTERPENVGLPVYVIVVEFGRPLTEIQLAEVRRNERNE